MSKIRFLFLMLCLSITISACQPAVPDQPLNPAPEIDSLIAELEAGEYEEIHSLLIWHDGQLLVEEYFRGYDQERPHELYSVTKSITSAGIGIAIEEGAINGVNEPLTTLMPQYRNLLEQEADKSRLTLENVLTMSSGFVWDESSTIYGSSENSVTQLTRSADWLEYVLSQPLAADPGTTFTYNSGNTMLLGGILSAQTGDTAERYIAEQLFTPLGIETWRWETGRPNITNTGWGLHLTPRDMLTFGRLYLNHGRWEDQQLVPAAWVEQSTAAHITADDGYEYGYQWWRYQDDHEVVRNLAVNDVYFAWGFGGQFIWVVPHLQLVVVTTAHNFENSSQIFPILPTYIFPWVQTYVGENPP